jgi:stearoyl-CoA desaturase (delta-9 desaturase)
MISKLASETMAGVDPFEDDDIVYPDAIPFVLVHLACLGVFWTGVHAWSIAMCLGLYVVRMWALTAGAHRYFSHRSYKTSRPFQFFLALLFSTCAQQGILWWAAKHREHHRYSDTPRDVHSPVQHGFWFSHVGWIFRRRRGKADYCLVQDLARYPELVWLDRHRYLPAVLLGFGIWLALGWEALVVGYLLSTVILYHGTFSINSLAHYIGRRRYLTGDDSRNNWWLAILTLGEGWHNNHHWFQSSTRQGFRWWELDPTYYVLKGLSWVGLVWDLREPPAAVVRAEGRLPRAVVEKVARQLAASFPVEKIREAWAHRPGLDAVREKLARARSQASGSLAELHLPHLPTVDELRQRAREMFSPTPSLEEVVVRARQILFEASTGGLVPERLAPGEGPS